MNEARAAAERIYDRKRKNLEREREKGSSLGASSNATDKAAAAAAFSKLPLESGEGLERLQGRG